MKLVQDTWGDAHSVRNLSQLQHTLGRMKVSFHDWERDVFGSVKQELASLRRELEDVRSRSLRAGPSNREKQIMHRILELLAREDIMEKQRSRIA